MLEFLGTSSAQAVIWGTVLLTLCIVGVYFVLWLRRGGGRVTPSANELLTDFREQLESGRISETEFQKIKGVLGPKLQAELRSEDAEETD